MGFAENGIRPLGGRWVGKVGGGASLAASSNSSEIIALWGVSSGLDYPGLGVPNFLGSVNWLDFQGGAGCLPNFRPGGLPSGSSLFRSNDQQTKHPNPPVRKA
ncbi:MAG: hypothetical protein ACKOE8_06450, partial [Opitutaceae bacterium]